MSNFASFKPESTQKRFISSCLPYSNITISEVSDKQCLSRSLVVDDDILLVVIEVNHRLTFMELLEQSNNCCHITIFNHLYNLGKSKTQ